MNLQKKLFWISLCFLIISCKKYLPKEDYPKEHYCEKFAGKYNMYDPVNDSFYDMICSCSINENELDDTIIFINYANRYNFEFQPGINGDEHISGLAGVIIYGLKDHSGNRTVFASGGFSNTPPRNILVGDSLYIFFSIDNLLYYVEDSVPWEACEDCLHYGVKVH
ncbi:MAG: hypothetical protein IPM74_07990 [Crocinitomicaceae bacterium]|nr:hypothetical protein [Crocinitomicaceae bacterium]MBK8925838.1 hypothetical protein [Crocinitomicaceae bacterium]